MLITALIFLLIFSLLGVSALNMSLLEKNIVQNRHDYFKGFYAAESILHQLEEKIEGGSIGDCHHNCPVDFYKTHLQYEIEDRGINNCIYSKGSSANSAHYYHIRVKAFSNQGGQTAHLESIYAVLKTFKHNLPCQNKKQLVVAGRQSWRNIFSHPN